MTHYQYRAIASNSFGADTSNPGTLYVNSGPAQTPVFDNPLTAVCGGSSQLVKVTGGLADDSIIWNVHVPGRTYTVLENPINDSITALNFPDTVNSATITVHNNNGCSRTNSSLTVTINNLQPTLAGVAGAGSTCISAPVVSGVSNFTSDASCNPISSITPSGASPVSGSIQSCVTVDASVQSYNGVPYVQRHYNIEPSVNPSTSTATLTLFFTQNDFDAYNLLRGSNPALPTGPSDAAGIANLRITQFHGTGTTPGTYTGTTGEIDPDDNNIVWNSTASRWEVTFSITGFSGFFISTGSLIPLPLTLTAFTGQSTENGNLLQWTTSQEQNTAYFDIQRSTPGAGSFYSIAKITAAGNSKLPLHYQYIDVADGLASYRLRMVDLDGAATYSKVVTLGDPGNTYAYNIKATPATYIVTAPAAGSAILLVTDISGRQIYQQRVTLTKGINTFPAGALPAGSYLLTLLADKQRCTTKFVRY